LISKEKKGGARPVILSANWPMKRKGEERDPVARLRRPAKKVSRRNERIHNLAGKGGRRKAPIIHYRVERRKCLSIPNVTSRERGGVPFFAQE